MRILYCSSIFYIDQALSFVGALSRHVELYFLLKLPPQGWQSGPFHLHPNQFQSGIIPAQGLLQDNFPPGFEKYWRDCAGVYLHVQECPKSFHPRTILENYRAGKFIQRIKPDVIHFDELDMRQVWMLHSLRKFPWVMNVHDPIPHSGEQNWRREVCRRIAYPNVKQFILHNQAQKYIFCKKYRVDERYVHTIKLGISSYRECNGKGNATDPKCVLFFGRLSPYKGLETLLEAAPIVTQSVSGVHFLIAGRPIAGYQIPPIPQLSNNSTVEVITKYISNDQLVQLFQRAAVVVCPYLDATQSAVVLTAFAFHKPVVASDVGGLPEYIADGATGFIVLPKDPFALAEKITALLTDHSLGREMGERIKFANSHELAWENLVKDHLRIYTRLIHK